MCYCLNHSMFLHGHYSAKGYYERIFLSKAFEQTWRLDKVLERMKKYSSIPLFLGKQGINVFFKINFVYFFLCMCIYRLIYKHNTLLISSSYESTWLSGRKHENKYVRRQEEGDLWKYIFLKSFYSATA